MKKFAALILALTLSFFPLVPSYAAGTTESANSTPTMTGGNNANSQGAQTYGTNNYGTTNNNAPRAYATADNNRRDWGWLGLLGLLGLAGLRNRSRNVQK